MKSYKKIAAWIGAFYVLALALGAAMEWNNRTHPAPQTTSKALQSVLSEYGSYEAVQKVFNNRCIVCHSCNNAPCQLKLTSYDGLKRGATKIRAINATRLVSIPPTRLGVDACTTEEWRKKGFFPVDDDKSNIILSLINQGAAQSPTDEVDNSHSCPENTVDLAVFELLHQNKLMPYGLPPLTEQEQVVLANWVSNGYKPPVTKSAEPLSHEQSLAKSEWEKFFNRQDLEHRLVARYLYEHLFLANLHFNKDSRQFYRIIRSRAPCDEPLSEIATRRPTDDPKESFFYCFKPYTETLVEKILLPYTLNLAKLDRITALFFNPAEPWKASHWPDYQVSEQTNPFILYQDIPIKARYRFLLDDAHYHVSTFIKGPVCYGSGAVSAIDEHFFVFFMNPESDLMVRDKAFAKASEALLVLPYSDGSNAPYIDIGKKTLDDMWNSIIHRTALTDKYIASRNEYVALKDKHRMADFPEGYGLNDLWNGDGSNPNAVLTVFRHNDSSYVMEGLRGGESSSYLVLDYALFERLVYNLVVGYDVFGNLSHQIHTRVYMGMIRREAEDDFLVFLPPAERSRLRGQWYQKDVDKLGKALFRVPNDKKFPTRINYHDTTGTDKELITKLAGGYLPASVRGPYDGSPYSEYPSLETIAERPASTAPFVNLFPDSSLLLIEKNGKLKKVVTIVRDRAHTALGWFVMESATRAPERDNLAVIDGLATSYPNLFFDVAEEHIPKFVQQLNAVNNLTSAQTFIKNWGVLKTDPRFWTISDSLHAYLFNLDPVHSGVLDYTRYGVWTESHDWHI